MSTSLEQVERLLAEIPYAQAHPGVTLAALAQEFGVSAAQARRDLTLAMMCGLPGQLPGDLIEVDLDELEGEGRVVFRYDGWNPNGSRRNIAGITNERGNVVGLMPHPEHAVEAGFGPDSSDGTRQGTDGLTFFTSVLSTLLHA